MVTRWIKERSPALRHIWLYPETVCYLDYDSDQACSVGPNPTPGSVGAEYRAHSVRRDYRGHNDYRVRRDYARANSHETLNVL
jgi:hypothetical protein